jgi:hypothetical protein
MKTIYLYLLSNLLLSFSFGQEVSLKPITQGDKNGDVFSVQVFNNTRKPIAIKCSPSFFNFSNRDTLVLGPVVYSDSNVYRIDFSFDDSKGSEASMYHLLIINPQTSLMTNIKLVKSTASKNVKFELVYSKEVSTEEIKTFTNYEKVSLTKKGKKFLSKSVDVTL